MLLLLLACAYSVEDYWDDLTRAHCQCEDEIDVADCRAEWAAYYESSAYYDACVDDPSPVAREDVKDWLNDYTESCLYPDTDPPQPADPLWFEDCEG